MKQIKFHHALQGPICAVLAISMVFLACQKEAIDELTILEQGEHAVSYTHLTLPTIYSV